MNNYSTNPQKSVPPAYFQPKRILFVLIFLVSGLAFLGLALFNFIPNDYEKYGIETTAIILTLDGGENDFPTVKFEVDGVSYEGEISLYDGSMKVGGTISIRYMKDNPNDFTVVESVSILTYFYLVFGAMLVFSSLLIFVSNNKKSLRRIYNIKKNGTLVKCCLVSFSTGALVYTYNNVISNNPISCTISCKDNQGRYYAQKNFVSDIAIDYSKPNFGFIIGDPINAYVSNTNPKVFAIDVIEYQERKVMENYNKQ